LKGPGGYAFAEIPSFYGDVRESESGKVRSALEEIDWIVERYPCRTGAYYRRGRAYHSWGELERAIDDYTRAIKLCSTFGEAYYCRGEAYDDKGNRSQAIADCKRATELKPGHKFERTKANIKNLQLRESDLHAPFGESMPVEYLEGQIHVTLEEARQRVHEAMLTVDPNYERVSDRIGYTSAVVWQHRGEYHVRLKNAGALLSRYVEAIQTALGESCGVIDED
jgi:tetratricopeptide (TPR) repeat protein